MTVTMSSLSAATAFLMIVANAQDAPPCRLWLAPSTMSTDDEPLLGVYAGTTYDKDEMLGPAETGIPVADLDSVENEEILSLLEDYLWPGNYVGNAWEGRESTHMAIPGLGSLSAYNPSTTNVDWNVESVLRKEKLDAFETGKAHPARGALSEYHNFTIYSTKRLEAGMEIFINYGDFEHDDENPNAAKHSPSDYKDADDLTDKILAFMEKHDKDMTAEKKKQVMDFLMEQVMGTAAGKRASELKSILPSHPGKLQIVKNMGGTFAYRNPQLVKTKKWLQKHGRCMDNLVAKTSTIPDAGRGAFVTRAVARNQVIAPAPMLHITDSEVFETDNGEQQLLVNYCFGHSESSMLLFPVGSVVSLINHKPAQEANARLMWSKIRLEDPVNWHSTAPNNMSHQRIGIVMDVVATKDIAAGDEVFIDYGPEWTEAWNAHMEAYKSREGSKWPVKAMDLTEFYKTEPFKTKVEREKEDYPEGVGTSCHLETGPNGVPLESTEGKFGRKTHQCSVVERNKDEEFAYLYTVVVDHHTGNMVTVKQVPHSAVHLVDTPNQSDMFAEGAFRHWIGLPDMLVPKAWRDRV